MTLIDIDAIPESATTISTDGRLFVAWSEIVKAPVIEAEPIKHGQWIEYSYRSHIANEKKDRYRCSICHHIEKFTTKYCADCGAKMDLEVNDGFN